MPIQSLSSEIGSFLTPESPGREGQETARAGQRKAAKPTSSLKKEEEEVFSGWQNGKLGGGTPRALLNTVWWLLTQHFGIRGRQEHHQMKVKDFTLQRDDRGNEFLTFFRRPNSDETEKAWREN